MSKQTLVPEAPGRGHGWSGWCDLGCCHQLSSLCAKLPCPGLSGFYPQAGLGTCRGPPGQAMGDNLLGRLRWSWEHGRPGTARGVAEAAARLLIVRDLQTWPASQTAFINQRRHAGEPAVWPSRLGCPAAPCSRGSCCSSVRVLPGEPGGPEQACGGGQGGTAGRPADTCLWKGLPRRGLRTYCPARLHRRGRVGSRHTSPGGGVWVS